MHRPFNAITVAAQNVPAGKSRGQVVVDIAR